MPQSRCARLALAGVLAFLFAGCPSRQKADDVAAVAKDWCLVIRASQVLPAYPLTEDLLPGDVFLSTASVEEEAETYQRRGFLPLPQHLKRLDGIDREKFYSNWLTTEPREAGDEQRFPHGDAWPGMPRAAFPTYRFAVDQGAGINVAIPVEGVPVALNLLGASSADGSITIADAYTWGTDIATAWAALLEWVGGQGGTGFLKAYAARAERGQSVYLRVIYRVYLTGRVNIAMADSKSVAADVAAGADKPLNLLGTSGKSSPQAYQAALSALQAVVSSDMVAGGRLKLAAASSRSVSLEETFPRPLVIGYLAFDCRVDKDGKLAAPVSTLSHLEGRREIEPGVYELGTSGLALRGWLYRPDGSVDEDHLAALNAWIRSGPIRDLRPSDLLWNPEYEALRLGAIKSLLEK